MLTEEIIRDAGEAIFAEGGTIEVTVTSGKTAELRNVSVDGRCGLLSAIWDDPLHTISDADMKQLSEICNAIMASVGARHAGMPLVFKARDELVQAQMKFFGGAHG